MPKKEERREEFDISEQKLEKRWKEITNIIFSFLFFSIVALICEFLGIGDWIRKNAVWFLLVAIGVVELDLIGTAEQFYRLTKGDTEKQQEDLIKKMGQLQTDMDHIKNTIRELGERR